MGQNFYENLRSLPINIAGSGDNTIVIAPTEPGNYIAVDFISLLPTTAVAVTFKSGAVALSGPLPLEAKQALTWENAVGNRQGTMTCAPNQPFIINLGAAVQVGGIIRYREVGN